MAKSTIEKPEVPAGLSLINMTCTGTHALLMHSERGLDPLDPLVKQMKSLSAQRKKTEDILQQMARTEYELSCYHDAKIGPYIPALVIEATFFEAAKLQKLGKVGKRALSVIESKVPLEYTGPRELKKLIESPEFRDVRGVRVGTAKVMRCRPKFNEWAITFNLAYDAEQLNRDVVVSIARDAGAKIGFCDFRPRFGRFDVEVNG